MRLTDSYSELFGYVVAFRKSVAEQQPAYEQVREDILQLFKKNEGFVAKNQISPDEDEQARYAVCAWVDETVLAANWNHKARWRPELLQRLHYGSSDAGEKFFDRLNRLGAHQNKIREVYYLCLALGFKGRYCAPGDEHKLEQLKTHQLKLIFDGTLESPSMVAFEKQLLFPDAYSSGVPARLAEKAASARRFFWMAIMGSPVAICVLFFIIYRYTLYSLGENILRAIRQL